MIYDKYCRCSIHCWFQRLLLLLCIQCCIINQMSFFVEGNDTNNNITKSYDDEILHHLELFHYSEELHVLGPTRFPKPTEIFQTISGYEDISNIQDAIVSYIRPVHGKHRPNKDALVAFAAEYPISNYLSFIESLRITGFKGDIILSISVLDMQKEDVWTYLTNADDEDEDGLRVILYAPKLTCYNAENEEVDSFKGGARGTCNVF